MNRKKLRKLFVVLVTGLMVIGITSAAYALPSYIIAGDKAYEFTDYRNAGTEFQSTVRGAMAASSSSTYIQDTSDKVISFIDFRNVEATNYAGKLAECPNLIADLQLPINIINPDGTVRGPYIPPGTTAGPAFSAATITAAGISNNINLSTDGLTGTLNLSSLTTTDTITAGTVTVTTGSTLVVTAITGQDGTNRLSLLTSKGLSTSQELTAGSANSLDLITYLGALDSNKNGVTMEYLRLLFGNTVTVTGTLTSGSNVGNVSLTITLK